MPDILQKVITRIETLEKRVQSIEEDIKGRPNVTNPNIKTITLPEIIFGKKFKSGQEKIVHKTLVGYADLEEGWKVGKFNGKYSPSFLARASIWVSNVDGKLDLTQTGEKFFNEFLKSNNGDN